MVGLFSLFNNQTLPKGEVESFISNFVTKTLDVSPMFSLNSDKQEILRSSLNEFDYYTDTFLDYFKKRTENVKNVSKNFVKNFINDFDKELKLIKISDDIFPGLLETARKFEATEEAYQSVFRKDFQNKLLSMFNKDKKLERF